MRSHVGNWDQMGAAHGVLVPRLARPRGSDEETSAQLLKVPMPDGQQRWAR
jgi:hypothetical protein